MTDWTMAWVDIETTGLNANEEVPLELGIQLTDNYGKMGPRTKWLIREQTQDFYAKMSDAKRHTIVGPMHEKSRLWVDLEGTCYSREQVDQWAVKWLQQEGIAEGTVPLCGNSVGSLDRPFILVHFPRLNRHLHYRNIDMSTVKELCKRLNPVLFDKIKPIVEDKTKAGHRVFSDIAASIREYGVYQDEFLIVGD